MSKNSAIEWTDDTWNPVTGCTEVSPGCDHCYAKTFAERWRGCPGHHFEQGFDLVLRPERLDQPLRWKKPRRVFVNSMSDLFHEGVPDEFIADVFTVMARAPQHTFQLLTKRHGRMRSLLSRRSFRDNLAHWGAGWPLPNVWLGVSVENQQWADIRIPALLSTPAAVRFLSCEPLLGKVDLARYLGYPSGLAGDWERLIDWVIVGGESGPGARPMHPDWVRRLRRQATTGGAAFMFKQWGAWAPAPWRGENGATHAYPGTQIRDASGGWVSYFMELDHSPTSIERTAEAPAGAQGMRRVGKGVAGRVLDGRTWDEFPEAVTA